MIHMNWYVFKFQTYKTKSQLGFHLGFTVEIYIEWFTKVGSYAKQQISTILKIKWYEYIWASRAMRKRVLCHMRTTNAQISLRAVWSAPLLFAA